MQMLPLKDRTLKASQLPLLLLNQNQSPLLLQPLQLQSSLNLSQNLLPLLQPQSLSLQAWLQEIKSLMELLRERFMGSFMRIMKLKLISQNPR